MKIDITKVAKLANLTLTADEEKEFDKQLNDIVGYIEKLNSVDTTGIAPTAQVTGLVNRTREDKIAQNSLSQKDALSGGKKIHNEMFVVDQTVDTTS
jgi:aspartyl-tRNA(Asn)/glutamyl-tRNA(Gln) amidotransferase subunit C